MGESAEGDLRSLTEGQWDTFWKIFQILLLERQSLV